MVGSVESMLSCGKIACEQIIGGWTRDGNAWEKLAAGSVESMLSCEKIAC